MLTVWDAGRRRSRHHSRAARCGARSSPVRRAGPIVHARSVPMFLDRSGTPRPMGTASAGRAGPGPRGSPASTPPTPRNHCTPPTNRPYQLLIVATARNLAADPDEMLSLGTPTDAPDVGELRHRRADQCPSVGPANLEVAGLARRGPGKGSMTTTPTPPQPVQPQPLQPQPDPLQPRPQPQPQPQPEPEPERLERVRTRPPSARADVLRPAPLASPGNRSTRSLGLNPRRTW